MTASWQLLEGFVDKDHEVMNELLKELPLKQEEINLGFKKVIMPRLISWHADKPYRYSGKTFQPSPWTNSLLKIKNRIENLTQKEFNSVLVNYYRNGQDSISWHADDEPEIDGELIASISLGSFRKFLLRSKEEKQLKYSYKLGGGSLFCMFNCQKEYEHSIPKTTTDVGPRMNLTFRKIINENKNLRGL